MFDRFDTVITQALTSEHSLYGLSDRSIATAAARRAAAENRVKALNEATLGKVGFAAIHETASGRFHEDAEAMARGEPPVHHSVGFYLSTAETYRKADARETAKPAKTAPPLHAAQAA